MNPLYLHIHFSCPFLTGHALQICHNIGTLILILHANQEASSPLLHSELSLGYSWCSYQNYEAWKNLARYCKVRKTDSEDYKREHCVISLQDFIATKPKQRPVFESRSPEVFLKEANYTSEVTKVGNYWNCTSPTGHISRAIYTAL